MTDYGPHLLQTKQTIMSKGMNYKKLYHGSKDSNINIDVNKYE
jgi:hypothetical protein